MAEIARDKAYRKLKDRLAFERRGVIYSDLKNEEEGRAIDEEVAGVADGRGANYQVAEATRRPGPGEDGRGPFVHPDRRAGRVGHDRSGRRLHG